MLNINEYQKALAELPTDWLLASYCDPSRYMQTTPTAMHAIENELKARGVQI